MQLLLALLSGSIGPTYRFDLILPGSLKRGIELVIVSACGDYKPHLLLLDAVGVVFASSLVLMFQAAAVCPFGRGMAWVAVAGCLLM